MIAFVGWAGAICMVAASWTMPQTIGFFLAILGLVLLSIQAWSQKNYNLLFVNFASIIGFSTTLWGIL